jgi:hypothetical protein
MWLIVLEAAGALALLVFIVWWTMFSGRRGGEMPPDPLPDKARASPPRPGQDEVGDDVARGGSRKLKG